MDYVVTAGLLPPVHIGELDALQREGVAALLDRQLGQVEGVIGPEGDDIDLLDYRITVHPDGTTVVLALEAPALRAAEEGAATVLHELVADSDLLAGWVVSDSEVQITEDEFNQSLAAAEEALTGDGSEADADLKAAIDEAMSGDIEDEEAALDPEQWRERLRAAAHELTAFNASAFGATEGSESAVLAAGALIHAVRVVTDEIFYDELALAVNNVAVDEAVGLLVLDELPPCYQQHYDAAFTRAFLLASAGVTSRLTRSTWTPPRCVAEALALDLVVNEARVVLEAAELMAEEEAARMFSTLREGTFGGFDHTELYAVENWLRGVDADAPLREEEVDTLLRARGLAFDQWFDTGEHAEGLHPSLRQS